MSKRTTNPLTVALGKVSVALAGGEASKSLRVMGGRTVPQALVVIGAVLDTYIREQAAQGKTLQGYTVPNLVSVLQTLHPDMPAVNLNSVTSGRTRIAKEAAEKGWDAVGGPITQSDAAAILKATAEAEQSGFPIRTTDDDDDDDSAE